jgi:hypothetical protein
MIISFQDLSMDIVGARLEKAFTDWKGEEDQVDDVLVWGIEI